MANVNVDSLVLEVTRNINIKTLDLDKYDEFLDELCGHRDYQKEAIQTTIRFLLGGEYKNTESLAKENFEENAALKDYYGTFESFKSKLEFPDKLACTIDLATATGKSWVMYGIAQIMLCEGAVDKVLILCPSITIKKGLTKKFETFVTDENLRATLKDSEIGLKINPSIIDSSRTIKTGDICIDNVHKTYSHTSSSIEDSLKGKGERTLIINDESHHLLNPQAETLITDTKTMKEWNKFLHELKYNFKYIVGLSGTPYLGNDYARDVIYRYNIMQAIEGRKAGNFVIKNIDYVQRDEAINEAERFEIIYNNHQNNKKRWKKARKHITIFVTQKITGAEKLLDRFVDFISRKEKISVDKAAEKVLIVTSSPKHEKNREILESVDESTNPIEWIISVSMLNEGWDVSRIFQIVPHEERAFNSKLLIAQVLGRGLRVPSEYESEQPLVTVYNHDKWSRAIKDLVYEVMSYENRVISYVVDKKPDYNFDLCNINYTKEEVNVKKHPVKKPFKIPKIPDLSSQATIIKRKTTYYQVKNAEEKEVTTEIEVKMYEVDQVVLDIYNKLAVFDKELGTDYSLVLNKEELKKKILEALQKIHDKTNKISEENKNRVERAFDVLQREQTGTTTIRRTPEKLYKRSTRDILQSSINASELQGNAAIIYEEDSVNTSKKEDVLNIKKGREGATVRNVIEIKNKYDFKCPLNVVILSYSNEIEFGKYLVDDKVAKHLDAWIKNVDRGFYPIPYSYRKGTHQKWANFNPDFFIKKGKDIIVIEIKSDEDISDVNKAKLKYARRHFEELNKINKSQHYTFKFLSKQDFSRFFETLEDGTYRDYVSNLEAELTN
jgi:type III restriction enzyme